MVYEFLVRDRLKRRSLGTAQAAPCFERIWDSGGDCAGMILGLVPNALKARFIKEFINEFGDIPDRWDFNGFLFMFRDSSVAGVLRNGSFWNARRTPMHGPVHTPRAPRRDATHGSHN